MDRRGLRTSVTIDTPFGLLFKQRQCEILLSVLKRRAIPDQPVARVHKFTQLRQFCASDGPYIGLDGGRHLRKHRRVDLICFRECASCLGKTSRAQWVDPDQREAGQSLLEGPVIDTGRFIGYPVNGPLTDPFE